VNDIQIVTSSPEAFLVNSFLLPTDTGVVVVDTQFLLTPAAAVADAVAATGRPLQAIILTHPHPDHCNGTGLLLQRFGSVPVYATPAVRAALPAIAAEKLAFWKPIHGAEYPDVTILPTETLGATLTIGGLTIHAEDVGAAESAANTVLHLPATDTLIASDLVYNAVHPWLVEGRSGAWLAALAALKSRHPTARRVHAGHGAPGTPALLDAQAAYITRFRALVAGALVDNTVPDAAKPAIIDTMKAEFPGFALDMLIGMNIDGVAAELAGK
jgi:glyoxylase-like metal-dependent hydrolase (beta-lactamase superfamily II)